MSPQEKEERIADFRARIDACRKVNAGYSSGFLQPAAPTVEADELEWLLSELTAIQEDAAESREDTARLDWVEDHDFPDPEVYDGLSLRQAIDAARSEERTTT